MVEEAEGGSGVQQGPRSRGPRFTVRPVVTPLPSRNERATTHDGEARPEPDDPFLRDEAEDDDGYDPFSDRPPAPEPTFQEDPWR